MIIKRNLPELIQKQSEELQSFFKSLSTSLQASKAASLEEFCLQRLKEATEEKRKHLGVIYKQIKTILKQAIFGFIDEVWATHKGAIREAFGEENQSFARLQATMRLFEEKLAEIRRGLSERSENYIPMFLDLLELRSQRPGLKNADEVLKGVARDCCGMPLEVELRLSQISNLFEFRNVEPNSDVLNDYSQRAYTLMQPCRSMQVNRPSQNETELLQPSDNEDEVDFMEVPGRLARISTSNLKEDEYATQRIRTAPFKLLQKSNLEINTSDLNLNSPRRMSSIQRIESLNPRSSRNKMTPFGGRRVSIQQSFQTLSTNQHADFVVPQMAAKPIIYQSLAANVQKVEEMPEFDLDYTTVATSKLSRSSQQPGRYPKQGLSTRLFRVAEGVALVESHSINELRLRDAFKMMLDLQPPLRKIEFRKNLFLADAVSVLRSLLTAPLPNRLVVEFVDNTFSKTKSPKLEVATELLGFNVMVKLG